jgi:alpha-L-fucosidase
MLPILPTASSASKAAPRIDASGEPPNITGRPDGEWEHPSELWQSTSFLAWLFNESPVKDDVAINDRWGKDCRSKHGGYYTTEYGKHHEITDPATSRKWEECRGMGASFGYNRYEDIDDYKPARDLIHLLINMVSTGGNLLLDIGPTADGRIPVIMQERLIEIGQWLEVNGEAIYGTKVWKKTGEGDLVRYTAKGNVVYAITLGWPGKELELEVPGATSDDVHDPVHLLGFNEMLKTMRRDDKLVIQMPQVEPESLPARHAYVFKIEGVNH